MKRRYISLVPIYSVSVLVACELAGRVNFFTHHDLPFWSPASHVAYRFYPNLQQPLTDDGGGHPRVLVLGASALNRGWSDFEVQLHEQLSALLSQDVRVVNLSMPAQTSLDSYYKYWYLRHQHFDLIILYNAINELRANNVPDDVWRDDYAHYAWYDEANFYFQHYDWTRYWFILPYYVKHLSVALDRKLIHHRHCVPYNSESIRPDWLAFGATIKSVKPFRQNLLRTVALANRKREPVLLMTYAYYIPPHYSRDRFQRGELGYAPSSIKGSPLDGWGRPEDVTKGLEAHNAVIRDLATNQNTLFVDQEILLGYDPMNFIDVCHYSPAGMQQFVHHIVMELMKEQWEPQVAMTHAAPSGPSPFHQQPSPSPSLRVPVPARTQRFLTFADQRHPFAFGTQVVWQERRRAEQGSGIYFYDLATGRGHKVLESTGLGEVFPKISGHRIISDVIDGYGHRDIYVYDQITKRTQRLTTPHAIGMRPDISDDVAVWTGIRDTDTTHQSRYDIFLHDFVTKREIRVTATDPDYDDINPAIDGNRIVWQSLRLGQSGIYLCTYNRATGVCPEHRIIPDDGGRSFLVGDPDISGTLVVFSKLQRATQEQTIYLYDLATDHTQPIATHRGFQQAPQIFGHRIVWQDRRDGVWNVYACDYDPMTGACPEQQITNDPWTQWQPTIAGDRIFWEDYRDGHAHLYMSEMRQ